MRKFIGGLCTFVVGLQVLIGVPLAVCLAFLSSIQGGMAPMNVEVHAVPRLHATIPPADFPVAGPPMAPPPNIIPSGTEQCSVLPNSAATLDNPILQTREETGSPLAGTVLADNAQDEQQLFLIALEKAAGEDAAGHCCAELCPLEAAAPAAADTTPQLTALLYKMAEIDEDAGHFERADQWRGLARELRSPE